MSAVRLRIRSSLLLFHFLIGMVTAQTGISSHLESDLRRDFEKKAVLVRHFYEGSLLRYDDSLRPVGAPEGSWTVTGYVEIKQLRIENDVVTIEGRRLAAIYDEKQRNMRLARYDEPVLFKIPVRSDDDARRKFDQIFVTIGEDPATLVPSHWRHYAETHEIVDLRKPLKDQPTMQRTLREGVYQVGGEISPPRPIYRPEPTFTAFARRFHIQGQTAILMTLNEKGEPEDLSIVKPLGAGLDEAAVQTVKQWRFEPALRRGEPVKVRIMVEVAYHLYPGSKRY